MSRNKKPNKQSAADKATEQNSLGDGPVLWRAIRHEVDRRGISPRQVIWEKAEGRLKKWHDQLKKEFEAGLREELRNTPPEKRKKLEAFRMSEWQDSLREQDFQVRQEAVEIEKIYLREELARLPTADAHRAEAATRLSEQHLHEDAQLLSVHELDLKRLHTDRGEDLTKPEVQLLHRFNRDKIETLQSLELKNLELRHESETRRLASHLYGQARSPEPKPPRVHAATERSAAFEKAARGDPSPSLSKPQHSEALAQAIEKARQQEETRHSHEKDQGHTRK